eukprot:5609999-Prymnesium_polylepis.1
MVVGTAVYRVVRLPSATPTQKAEHISVLDSTLQWRHEWRAVGLSGRLAVLHKGNGPFGAKH